MLNMDHQGVTCARLWRAEKGSTYGASQVSRRRPHGRVLIDGAEVSHDRAANRCAMTIGWFRLRVRGNGWAPPAAGNKREQQNRTENQECDASDSFNCHGDLFSCFIPELALAATRLPETLRRIKNLAGGLLVPWQVVDSVLLVAPGYRETPSKSIRIRDRLRVN